MSNSYVSIDLETTGLYPKKDKIIEVGAIKVKDGIIVDTFQTFCDPGVELPEKVIEITGIQREELLGQPRIDTIMNEVISFIGDEDLLGHNILFDYSFLKRAAGNQKLPFEKNGYDTLQIARKYLTELPSKNLGKLCEYYGISHEAHRALGDAIATHLLFQKLKTEFEKDTFLPKQLCYQVKREGPVTKHQKERLYELIARHNLKVDYNVEMLTKNEASRYTDQILSTYGR